MKGPCAYLWGADMDKQEDRTPRVQIRGLSFQGEGHLCVSLTEGREDETFEDGEFLRFDGRTDGRAGE